MAPRLTPRRCSDRRPERLHLVRTSEPTTSAVGSRRRPHAPLPLDRGRVHSSWCAAVFCPTARDMAASCWAGGRRSGLFGSEWHTANGFQLRANAWAGAEGDAPLMARRVLRRFCSPTRARTQHRSPAPPVPSFRASVTWAVNGYCTTAAQLSRMARDGVGRTEELVNAAHIVGCEPPGQGPVVVPAIGNPDDRGAGAITLRCNRNFA